MESCTHKDQIRPSRSRGRGSYYPPGETYRRAEQIFCAFMGPAQSYKRLPIAVGA
jgi:hypothetical protein